MHGAGTFTHGGLPTATLFSGLCEELYRAISIRLHRLAAIEMVWKKQIGPTITR